MDWQLLSQQVKSGETAAIARAISLVENNISGCSQLLESLQLHPIPVVGITGPPGAGKSSIVNELAQFWLGQNLKVAVIAVDPSSPFNFGALLGDRLRMAGLFTHPGLFIRSLSSRGSLGGLSTGILETIDIFKHAGFDRIIVETVGVGQSEVEIAGVADTTIVVTVPESGDEVQTLKSGVMEIADVFVVNKSDREGAARFAGHLRERARENMTHETQVIETIATTGKGIDLLSEAISSHYRSFSQNPRKYLLMAEKLSRIVAKSRMQDFNTEQQARILQEEANKPGFNLYVYANQFNVNS
jgi:LAO/AO transport system kinase